MSANANRLPNRFPVGTKFIVEGRPARDGQPAVYSRYVELPDGRSFTLPARSERAPSKTRQRLRRRGK